MGDLGECAPHRFIGLGQAVEPGRDRHGLLTGTAYETGGVVAESGGEHGLVELGVSGPGQGVLKGVAQLPLAAGGRGELVGHPLEKGSYLVGVVATEGGAEAV